MDPSWGSKSTPRKFRIFQKKEREEKRERVRGEERKGEGLAGGICVGTRDATGKAKWRPLEEVQREGGGWAGRGGRGGGGGDEYARQARVVHGKRPGASALNRAPPGVFPATPGMRPINQPFFFLLALYAIRRRGKGAEGCGWVGWGPSEEKWPVRSEQGKKGWEGEGGFDSGAAPAGASRGDGAAGGRRA